MTLIIGFCILLIFYFVGQCISYLIGGVIPGSIIGMILLFAALHFKLLNPAYIRTIARGLTKNMAIFFIPAGVGLMTTTGLLAKYWISILVAASLSTILVIAVVALTQEKFEKKRKKK